MAIQDPPPCDRSLEDALVAGFVVVLDESGLAGVLLNLCGFPVVVVAIIECLPTLLLEGRTPAIATLLEIHLVLLAEGQAWIGTACQPYEK